MRDRFKELLPLLLVGVVLLVFQLSRGGTLTLPFASPHALVSTPTPVAIATPVAGPRLPIPPRATLTVALCNPAQPRFVGGMATLKAALGANMGDALECEQSVESGGGDTQQKTTMGLAYYRRQVNVACFTTGWDHWGLIGGRVVHWAGESVDPPPDATILQ